MISRQFKIAIDAGHGGRDSGARGNGLKEKDITLSLAFKVREILQKTGVPVVMTRTTDRYIDLTSERTPKADISLSIHVNAGGTGKGLETWVSLFHNPAESRKLGQLIQDNILKQVPFVNRGLKTRKNSKGNGDYYYMIRKPPGVAVLVECGFIDYAGDAEILRSEEYLNRIALGIAKGVTQYCFPNKERDYMFVKLKLDTQVDLPEVPVKVNGSNIGNGVILNDMTFVPVRTIAESLNAKVDWDASTRTVLITKGGK